MRVLSAIQPTGTIHLGNYLGAIRQFLDYQEKSETILAVADLHAMTANLYNPNLKEVSLNTLAMLLACGIDQNKATLFIQSENPDHLRLSWIFTCVARLGWLGRMTQFKDKSGENQEMVSLGLFTYPILMVADILAYSASHVPVGEDQKQHLELACDIVRKYNNTFAKSESDNLTFPQAMIPKTKIARVMSLRDGLKKMSKSEPSDMSRINLTDSDDMIAKKISKAKSDSLTLPASKDQLKDRPEAENLLSIYAEFQSVSLDKACETFANKNFSFLKSELTDLLVGEISKIRSEYTKLIEDKSHLSSIAKVGLTKAMRISTPIVDKIYKQTGLS